MRRSPAVFLDRDGTLINERGYLSDPARMRFYASVFSGLRMLQRFGFKLIVITNQSGVARGLVSLKQLRAVHDRLRNMLKAKGVKLAGVYFCPHLPEARCRCRKPGTLLARRAARAHRLDLRNSFVIGDQDRDMALAERIGARGILVLTGAGRQTLRQIDRKSIKVTPNVQGAAKWIVGNIREE